MLRLRAEVRLPGRAWLQFEVSPRNNGTHSRITQTAFFEPKGLPGTLYWSLVRWLHRSLFAGQLRALADRTEQRAADRDDSPQASGAASLSTSA